MTCYLVYLYVNFLNIDAFLSMKIYAYPFFDMCSSYTVGLGPYMVVKF